MPRSEHARALEVLTRGLRPSERKRIRQEMMRILEAGYALDGQVPPPWVFALLEREPD